jgi:two-component system, OmpR family, sensor kinase
MDGQMKSLFQRKKDNAASPEAPASFFREMDIQFLIHELKDPVAVIETGARTLLEKQDKFGDLSNRQERTLKRVLRSVRKTREMLYHLLEVGRSESGCFVCCRFNPAQAIMAVLLDAMETMGVGVRQVHGEEPWRMEELASRYGIIVEMAAGVDDLVMYQDETKFRQIVGNLIKNAIHHRRERMEIKLGREHEQIVLDIVDDGPGIAPEHHEFVFQRYAQVQGCALTPRKGHGLGLAGALVLARCLGGNVEIHSEKGNGASFRLTLPMTFVEAHQGV